MASTDSPEFPGERSIVCRNPDLAAERIRGRQDLLAASERDLARIGIADIRERNPMRGAAEIALAVGPYISVPAERAFRRIKAIGLQVHPVHHWLADCVRGDVFLCVLTYYLEWHMRQKLSPLLFDGTDKEPTRPKPAAWSRPNAHPSGSGNKPPGSRSILRR